MFEAEARWIAREMERIDADALSPLLHLGSSDRHFREVRQPWIHAALERPLAGRGIPVVNADLTAAAGVDVAARRARGLPRRPREVGVGDDRSFVGGGLIGFGGARGFALGGGGGQWREGDGGGDQEQQVELFPVVRVALEPGATEGTGGQGADEHQPHVEAGNDKEHIHADETATECAEAEVKEYNRNDGQGPQTVDVTAITKCVH